MPRYSLYFVILLSIGLLVLILYQDLDILYLDIGLLFIYSFVGLRYVKRIPKLYRLLLLIIICVFAIELTSYFSSIFFRTNHPVYHFAVPIEVFLYWLFFRKSLFHPKHYRWFLITLLTMISMSILNSIFLQDLSIVPSYGMLLLWLFVISCSLFQFRAMLELPSTKKLHNQPIFWFNIGTFIFYTLSFVIFGLHDALTNDLPDIIFDFVMWLNLSLYFIYFLAIYLSSKPKNLTNDPLH